jgi:hypothetical protein
VAELHDRDRLGSTDQMPDQSKTGNLFTYFDREARIVWLPVGRSDDVFDEETPWGSYAYDGETQKKVGFEIWASGRFPTCRSAGAHPAALEEGAVADRGPVPGRPLLGS